MSRPLLPNVQDPGQSLPPNPQQPLQYAVDPTTGQPSATTPTGAAARVQGTPTKPTYSKRGKITIVACVPCRKRKTKCDGQRPSCSQCAAREGQCSYDMTDDQRKLTYLRDNVEQLTEKTTIYEGLLQTVSHANEEEATEVFRRLRSGSDFQHVAEQVQAGRLLSGVGMREAQIGSMPPPDDQGSFQNAQDQTLQEGDHFNRLCERIASANSEQISDLVRRIKSNEDITTFLDLPARSGPPSSKPLIKRKSPIGIESHYARQDQTFAMVTGSELAATHASSSSATEFVVSRMEKPWTEVTQNDELIKHLLDQYFTWQHSFFQSFPEPLFRGDMAAGRTKFCSNTLVNAICAAGCLLSDRLDVKKKDSDGKSLLDRFVTEALKLLNEEPRSTLTTTAAMGMLSYIEGTRGNFSGLWTFGGRSILMAVDLSLHLKKYAKPGDDPQSSDARDEEQARIHAFWGCFHNDQIVSFTLGRHAKVQIQGVTADLPTVDREADNEPWQINEHDVAKRKGARSSTFRQCAELSKIINSTLLMFFAPSDPLSGRLLLQEYNKYLEWRNNLPEIVASIDNAPPHVLCLHMYYHTAVLLLFRPFLKASITDSEIVPRDVCRESANAISDLWETHARLYGNQGLYMFQIHCLLTACTIYIINVPTIQATNRLVSACQSFRQLSEHNEWAGSCLSILRDLAEKWSLILPQELEAALYGDEIPQGRRRENNQGQQESYQESVPDHQQPTDPMSANLFAQNDGLEQQLREEHQAQAAAQSQVIDRSPTATTSQQQKRPAPIQGPSQNKRQRLSASHNPYSPVAPPDGTQQSQNPASYLYSPLAYQPAPMLQPVYPSNPAPAPTANMTGHVTAQSIPDTSMSGTGAAIAAPTEPSQTIPRANIAVVPQNQTQGPAEAPIVKVEGTTAQTQGQQPPQPGSAQQPQQAPQQSQPAQQQQQQQQQPSTQQQQGGRQKRAQGKQNKQSVEGMSFEDDWRDPFMGYLGQTE